MNINMDKDFVSTTANTADILSQVLVATVPDKRQFVLKNGTVLILDLQDSSGDQISANSMVYIGGKRPTPVWPRKIDDKSYRPYKALLDNTGISAEYNKDNQDPLKIEVENGGLKFIEEHEIHIWVDSPDVIDLTKSTIEFNVEESPYRDSSR